MGVPFQARSRYFSRLAVLSSHEAIRGWRPESSWIAKDRGAKSTCAGYCYTAYQRIHSGFTIDIVLKFYRQIKAFAGKDSGAFFIGGN